MATVDHTFTVEAPPGVVFAYLTDREKATVWQASLLEAHFSPDAPVHKGRRSTRSASSSGERLSPLSR
jgi:uncharacterized protein YndB with AHSA1/START domain